MRPVLISYFLSGVGQFSFGNEIVYLPDTQGMTAKDIRRYENDLREKNAIGTAVVLSVSVLPGGIG